MDIFNLISKKRAETGILLLFLIFFLFLRTGQPWGHSLSQDYPVYFNANDNFLHSEFSDYVKEEGNYAYHPAYVAGGYGDVVGYLPPILYHLSAMVSNLTGLETYVTTYLVVVFMMSFGCLLVYFAIRKVNETLAILSLPFMLGVFSFSFEIAYSWGLWIFLTGGFFLLAFIWVMENMDRKYSFLLLALFLSGMALGHTSELIFALIFMASYFAVRIFRGNLKGDEVKGILAGLTVFAVISGYYLIIFYFTWMQADPFTFSIMERPVFAPDFGVNPGDFGVTQYLLYAGILFFFFIFLLKEDSDKLKVDGLSPALLSGIFILVMGFTNYVGFGVRAFQLRILWPVLLAVLMGLAIYFIPAHLKRWRFRYAYAVSVVLLAAFLFSHFGQLQGGGIIDPWTWDGFVWLSEKTPEDAKVYHFYSRPMTQTYSLFAAKRLPYFVDVNDYTEALKASVIKSDYQSGMAVLQDTRLPYRESLLSYGYHSEEAGFADREIDMWGMDYYLFALADPDPQNSLVIYNRYVREFMLNQTWIEEAYSNEVVSILRNNEPGRRP